MAKSKSGKKGGKDEDANDFKVVAKNSRAYYEFEVLDKFEAGLVLLGTEIKAIRQGKVTLQEAYCRIEDSEAFLVKMHIPEYEMRGYVTHDPTRKRKLLLHRQELRRIDQRVTERGLTLVPLRLYLKAGVAKIEIALARGRKRHDKRQALAKADAEREMRRVHR